MARQLLRIAVMTPRGTTLLATLAAAFASVVQGAPAQGDTRAPRGIEDPYVRGDAAILEGAGYLGYGPFRIGRFHGSAEFDAEVGPGRALLWLETRHFRVGARLPEYRLSAGDSRQREKLRAELLDLRAILPAVDVHARALDPWLRLHLLAARCERSYSEFLALTGRTDADFARRGTIQVGDDAARGIGPYLGQREKFVVLVAASEADLQRYSMQYFGERWAVPRTVDLGYGLGMLVGLALDMEGDLFDDTALHCRIAQSLVEVYCEAFGAHLFDTPAWFRVGLALDFARRVDPRFPGLDRATSRVFAERARVDWTEHAQGLALRGGARPLTELGTWRDATRFGFNEQVAAWSRVAFLRSSGDAGVARFLARLKAPIWRGPGTVDYAAVLLQQDRALRIGFGYGSLADLDAAWIHWCARRR